MPRWLMILLLLTIAILSGAIARANDTSTLDRHGATTDLVADQVVIIGLGESVRLNVESGTKIHISDGGVVRSRVVGRTVMMTGKRTGKTSLRVLGTGSNAHDASADRMIVVTERKVAATARLFQNYIETHRGLKFSASALPSLIVTGELLRLEDWSALMTFARESKVAWRLEAKIFPDVLAAFRRKIEAELTRLAWPGQSLSIDDNGPTLTAGSDSSNLTAEQKLSVTTMGVQLETSSGLTELEPMVRTQIVIAEMRTSRARNLGVKWANVMKGSVLPSLQIPTEALNIELVAMEQEGAGRILAMPNLLCRSGGEAKFMAGGEIPIRLISERAAAVEWKKYGILLHVQPKADRMKRMKFQLSTEISTIDKATTTKDGVPGFLTNRIETQFNLNGSQTIVLSGLIKNEDSLAADGLPLLRSIPVLGSLFGSEDFQKRLTELIVFVTPEVVIPDGESRGN